MDGLRSNASASASSAADDFEKAERKLNMAESLGEKQYGSALKSITLLKDSDYSKWHSQIERLASAFDWHPSILDQSKTPPTAAEHKASPKIAIDRKIAYMICRTTTDGSVVEDILQACKHGEAREAYQYVHSFYHSKSAGGRQAATLDFFSSTMATTNTNITQWIAKTARQGTILNMATGNKLDEAAQLLQLCAGLLPEFEPIRNHIELQETGTVTIVEARAKLIDFAKSKKLLSTTKGGNNHQGKSNIYHADASAGRGGRGSRGKGKGGRTNTGGPDLTLSKVPSRAGLTDCRKWVLDGTCGYNPCRFNHPPKAAVNFHNAPPGGVATDPPADAVTDDTPTQSSVFASWVPSQHADAPTAPCKATVPWSDDLASSPAASPDISMPFSPFEPDFEPEPAQPEPTSIAYACVLLLTALLAALTTYSAIAVSTIHRAFARVSVNGLGLIALTIFAMSMYGYRLGTEAAKPTHLHTHSFMQPALFLASDTHTCQEAGYEWCSDSGTNRFVTNDARDFIPGTIVKHNTVVAVGGGTVTSTQTGTVLVKSNDHNHQIYCTNVLFLPKCAKKLMPASTFVKKGCTISYTKLNKCYLTDKKGKPIFTGKEIDGLYFFNGNTQRGARTKAKSANSKSFLASDVIPPTTSKSFSASDATTPTTNVDGHVSDEPPTTYFGLKPGARTASAQDFPQQLHEAHCSYGHLNFDKLRKLLGLKKGDNPTCEACTISKSKAEALRGQTYTRSTRTGHRIHMDLGFTRFCNFIFQLYVDDYDRFTYIDIIETKDLALPSWIDLKNTIENDIYPAKVAFIRTDSEPNYRSEAWRKHAADCNLTHELSSRYRHDQNGTVEIKMYTVGTCFRTMMIEGCAPDADTPDCLRHAVVIINHSPTKANNGWTPREKRAGMKLPFNKILLRGPLFCLVFAHVYSEERGKHEARGVAAVYLGYDPINNSYLVKEWATGQRYYTADLKFHLKTFPYRANPQRSIGSLTRYDDMAPFLTSDAGTRVAAIAAPRGKSTRVRMPTDASFGSIPDVDSPPEPTVHMVHSFGPDPLSMNEAKQMHDACDWIEAELKERNSFKEHDVYETVLRSTIGHARVYKNKVVLSRKINPPDEFNPGGTLDKHKCRMTIAAYTKMLKQGIDYEEKHASTVRWNALKVMVALANKHDFDITSADISTVFLYGDLSDVMHMEIPEGWGEDGMEAPDYVWRLKKSVYGMPQAGHCAQKVLKKTIDDSGLFNQSKADDCVFVTKDHDDGYAALGTFVDDQFIVSTPLGTEKVLSTLKTKFKITVKRNPKVFCGVQIERIRERKWLKLHQQAYTEELLKKHNMADARSADTPMDPGTAKHLMQLPTEHATPSSIKAYQEIVGGLMWLMRTRPDMYYTINLLARYLRSATDEHVAIAKGRPLRYLVGTKTFGLVYSPGTTKFELEADADSDLAGDINTARSTSGSDSKIGEYGNLSASSRLDRKISTSTGQAETYAFQELCKDVIWIRLLLRELGFAMPGPTPCRTDNDGVLKQATKAVNHAMAKHYRIAQAFIRMLTTSREIVVLRVNSEDNPADTFTKPLPKGPFIKHRLTIMGPQDPPSLTSA